MKLYIAGPMANHVNHNWPAFEKEAELLRAAGYEVVSPTDVNGTYEEACALPYMTCLKNDIKAMLDCDGVALLPGWTESKGAKIERGLAEALGMPAMLAEIWRNPVAVNASGDIG